MKAPKQRIKAVTGLVTGFIFFTALPALAASGSGAPDPAPQAPPGLDAAADQFVGWFKWAALVTGVVGLIICGLMMMAGRRNRSATSVDGATGVPWVLGGLTIVSFAAAIVGQVLS